MLEIEEYIEEVDENRRDAFRNLYETVKRNMPVGFEERMRYGMITFVVPLDIYPDGYLCRKDEPLPMLSIGCKKNHLAVYHMGIMANPPLLEWFSEEYAKVVPTKLNMGKSCIRFTNVKNIPFELMGELATKVSVDDWVEAYVKITERNK